MLELHSETDGYIQDVREGSTFKLHDGRFVGPAQDGWRSQPDGKYFLIEKKTPDVEVEVVTLEMRLAELQGYRDEAIDSGITANGHFIYTDDRSQARITGAGLAVTLDSDLAINWKTGDGTFVTLNATEVVGIAQAVREHVQACFDREAELIEALNEAEDITAVDLSTGWPV